MKPSKPKPVLFRTTHHTFRPLRHRPGKWIDIVTGEIRDGKGWNNNRTFDRIILKRKKAR
jgi:hypothetical protein